MKEAFQVYVPDRVRIDRRPDGSWSLVAEIDLDGDGTVGEVFMTLDDASLRVRVFGHEQPEAQPGAAAVAVGGLFATDYTVEMRSVLEPDEHGFRLKTRVRPPANQLPVRF